MTQPAAELTAAAEKLRARIQQLKRENPQTFDWYPYDSLANAARMDRLLGTQHRHILDAAAANGVLDVGCGDGEMSFLFESLGCRVDAIDYAVTNHNGMQGVRALKKLLGSPVEIQETDIDEQLNLPAERRGLALFLGILYHLKNPFQAMDRLSRHAAYCFLSTRVAQCFPGGKPMPKDQPIAYLVDADELNADETNYWIFSKAGLGRLLKRTNWEVLASLSTGDTDRSDPVSARHDERVFCLLRSHYGLANVELLDGWHEVEGAGWRWTARRFSLRASVESGNTPQRFRMRLYLPADAFEQLGPVTISGSVNNRPLRPLKLDGPGDHVYEARLRGIAKPLVFAFEVDKFRPPRPTDGRELGIVIASIQLE